MSEFEVMNMLADVGLPYLSAGKNQWIDGERKIHDFRDMGEAYLNRCINTMEQQRSNVIYGFFLSDCKYGNCLTGCCAVMKSGLLRKMT